MRTVTHIQALTEFATAIKNSVPQNRANSERPIGALSSYLKLQPQTHQFARVLTWLIAFYHDAMVTLDEADLTDKNRATAKTNTQTLFAPFLPPFGGQNLGTWYVSAMSSTNQSYFDLLSDVIVKQHPIYLPDQDNLSDYKKQLESILIDIKEIGLPKWIERDYEEAVALTILAIDKLPFVAHRIVQDAHSTILARLFSVASPEHRKFMVRVATTVNLVLAAFVMPHEASEAAASYYGWVSDSPVSLEQIEACARPLALPAPEESTPREKG